MAAFRAALADWTRGRVPLYWAAAQYNLGIALEMIGERETGTAHLEQAVAAFRASLEERTRDRMPVEWEKTKEHLDRSAALLAKKKELLN